MTYASPVFAHAAPKALHRLQEGREPTRDGFLRHPMPRRLHQASSIAMSRAVGTACAVRPHSVKLSSRLTRHPTSSRPTK
ncbi:hypothetical protein EVAR_40974_1 [Eumeta japonica]|uniref:Uncharacterized protein n=1 Tax=Eumeta variegata TaxID=151549 RepID=A0A4C1X5H7_EUMVA|nr:hypothetical protein EVAR_40974_1 [Eumeta japonica]